LFKPRRFKPRRFKPYLRDSFYTTMPAASRTLLAPLLLRAALGLGDDVLLLQQRPDGPWSRPLDTVHELSSSLQDFEAMATNDDPEQPDEAHLAAAVAQEALAERVGKPKQQLASPADGPPVMPAFAKDLSRGPVLRLVGEGACRDPDGNTPTPYMTYSNITYRLCADYCSNSSVCQSCDFLFANGSDISVCKLFKPLYKQFQAMANTFCFWKTATATARGDPHLTNMRGDKFDIRRPGNHTFLVVPHGAGVDDADLYVWADVTPLDGKLCKFQSGLYITELTLAGSWLKSMGSLRLSTGTKDFNTPATWGLSIGGSGNLSVQEFTRRLPPSMAAVTMTNPEGPNRNKKNSVNTMQLKLSVGPTHLTVGWAHTQDPMSNWLWLSVNGVVGSGKLGGLLGEDDHTWVTKPLECEGP